MGIWRRFGGRNLHNGDEVLKVWDMCDEYLKYMSEAVYEWYASEQNVRNVFSNQLAQMLAVFVRRIGRPIPVNRLPTVIYAALHMMSKMISEDRLDDLMDVVWKKKLPGGRHAMEKLLLMLMFGDDQFSCLHGRIKCPLPRRDCDESRRQCQCQCPFATNQAA